jgi:N-acylneuraminate cytidylyltransferase
MIVGVIPARGGSKGIPGKNIKRIAGKPLLEWTVQHAKASRMLDRILVSTENGTIGRLAEKCGAEWWRRPESLSTDTASTLSVLKDVVDRYPARISTVVVLQCTSPIRSRGLIDECVRIFNRNRLDSLATGFIDKHMRYGKYQHCRRQDYKGYFCDDGNVYVIRAVCIKKGDRLGKTIGGVVVSREENIEIDDMLDFRTAEHFLLHPLKGVGVKGLGRGTGSRFLPLAG